MVSNLLNKTAKTAILPLTLLGLVTAANSASAVTLTGSIGIVGSSEITENSTTTTINFDHERVNKATGDFSSLLHSNTVDIEDLLLTKGADIPYFGTSYSNSDIASFIDFGWVDLGHDVGSGDLTFDLDGGATFLRSTNPGGVDYSNPGGITGVFKFDGYSFATGFINSSFSGSSSNFHITLVTDDEPQSVPEPATTGAFLFLGAIGATKVARRKKIS